MFCIGNQYINVKVRVCIIYFLYTHTSSSALQGGQSRSDTRSTLTGETASGFGWQRLRLSNYGRSWAQALCGRERSPCASYFPSLFIFTSTSIRFAPDCFTIYACTQTPIFAHPRYPTYKKFNHPASKPFGTSRGRWKQTPGFRLGIHQALCDVMMTQSVFMCSQWSDLLLLLLDFFGFRGLKEKRFGSASCKYWATSSFFKQEAGILSEDKGFSPFRWRINRCSYWLRNRWSWGD